jgi:DNA topoisomerase IB
MRLRRSRPSEAGWSRRRSGSAFRYVDQFGRPVTGEDAQRCRSLVIPPAWRDVWICPYPNGHIQAIGTDAKGRRQYLYHPDWRTQRDLAKHDRVLAVAEKLPRARKAVVSDLGREGMPIERALATAFRLLDLGYFRIGSDTYTTENGSYGLTTLERRHVHRHGNLLLFEFVAKSGVGQHIEIIDPLVLASVETMRRRKGGAEQLLSYRHGRSWRGLTASDVNDYLKQLLQNEVSAKDFRTWHGTVKAAVALAHLPATTNSGQQRAIAAAMREVAQHLGNTPTVARASYVDERVIDRYRAGETIAPALVRAESLPLGDLRRTEREERAVLRLIGAAGKADKL